MKIKHLQFLLVLLLTITLASASVPVALADGALPINEHFGGTQPGTWELRGNAEWNANAGGDSTLRLTDNANDESGLGFYDASFPSSQGIVAEFTYYANEGDGADGTVFFLVDGDQVDASNIEPGAYGGALGYAQSDEPHNGIPHAYLGVGFDEYGNFLDGNGGPGRIPNSVALRGSGNGTTGYEYLTSRNVQTAFGHEIDTGWRTARITVSPADGGATVRVEMSFDGGATWRVVIDDYTYAEIPPENLKLGFAASTGGSTNVHAIGRLNVTIPADLEMNLITSPSGTYHRGDAFTYTYSVVNNGPNSAGVSSIRNDLPLGDSGFANVVWSYTTTSGGSGSGDSTTVSEIPITLPVGVTATITVSGTIGANVIDTDDLYINLEASPDGGINDPSPSSAELSVDIVADVPTPELDTALDVIERYASTRGGVLPPTVAQYTAAGITGVTFSLLAVANWAMANAGPGAAITSQHAQTIIDQAIYNYQHPGVLTTRTSGGGSSMQDVIATSSVRAKIIATTTPARDLKLGMKGDDVRKLQQILISKNTGPQAKLLAKSNAIGSFGPLTQKALVEYQKANKILPATGYFGKLTKEFMKKTEVASLWW